jgi:hypothetical protein
VGADPNPAGCQQRLRQAKFGPYLLRSDTPKQVPVNQAGAANPCHANCVLLRLGVSLHRLAHPAASAPQRLFALDLINFFLFLLPWSQGVK